MSGLYDGLFVMQDEQTGSLWNHLTGESMYGQHAGETMPASNLLHMNVTQALEADPDMLLAVSDRPYVLDREGAARWSPEDEDAELFDFFVATLGEEDDRRPQMDIGLGVWTADTQRYYPMELLRENGFHNSEALEGRELLVVLEPLTSTPLALYWTTSTVTRDGRDLLLDDGYRISNSQLFDGSGERVAMERPMQSFTRWYGFSLTFPETEVAD